MSVRPGDRQPVVELFEARAREGAGLEGDDRAKGKRGLTLISVEQWFDVIGELETVLPWHARRANLLVEGIDLRTSVGERLRIGEVEVRIWNETKPCAEMEEIHVGLRGVLAVDMRGGVHGEILNDGVIKVGDAVRMV